MQIDILTPEKKIFSGEAESIVLQGTDGLFEVLNGHAPMIASLAEGTARVKTADGEKRYEVKAGFVEVLNNAVSVLVEGGVEAA